MQIQNKSVYLGVSQNNVGNATNKHERKKKNNFKPIVTQYINIIGNIKLRQARPYWHPYIVIIK